MSYLDFADLKARVSIEQVADLLGLALKQTKQNEWRGPCPACKSTDPRALVITRGINKFYCWTARKGGDVINLVAHVKGIGQKEAAELIAGAVQVPAPAGRNSTSTVPEGTLPVTGIKPLEYLEPGHEAVTALGISEATAKFFAGGYAGRGTMRGRVLFPIHSRDGGALLAYCGIATSPEASPRFLLPSNFDPATEIFNAHRIEEGDLLLCRDVLEVVLACERDGLTNAVCFLTPSVSPAQWEQLASLMDERRCEAHLP